MAPRNNHHDTKTPHSNRETYEVEIKKGRKNKADKDVVKEVQAREK